MSINTAPSSPPDQTSSSAPADTASHDHAKFNNPIRLPISISLTINDAPNNSSTNNGGVSSLGILPSRTATSLAMMHNAVAATATTAVAVEANAAPAVNTTKSIRHFIYPPNQVNQADFSLDIHLPPNTSLPERIDQFTLRRRMDKHGLFSIRLTPFIDTSSSSVANQGLFFDPIIRTAGAGSQIIIGRYTERVREAISKIPDQYHPVVFKSKVISRTHGCFKVDDQGNWLLKDVKSSSGTFLNHQRLSSASTISNDHLLHDGDIIQLGMDFRGGTEEIYRCVKMKIELNKSWKLKANAFNKEALNRIKNLQKLTTGLEQEDCSICLNKIKPCQAIFISPCAHSWHFHCVRRLVIMSYPQFMCPNCRSNCDLETTLESESESDSESENENEDEPDIEMDVDMEINNNLGVRLVD
ncbi:Dma1p [Saccharomyces cerevisiae x Saccharomyces kudriavzevii VIN7]|uniref:RING-type E3 ubiquitin transferase n=1 Tax=Saccharomyces cerevisiae x Saccharomyces kudriavzevii (strain VIN7) TaxID=1095631 RepID=H0GVV6_SACCK|nr:Dma1p [Saccharomyces cerevisiae x Saccharomyces kudriavzevii VIN7]